MCKTLLITIFCIVSQNVVATSLIEQVKDQYNALDKQNYCIQLLNAFIDMQWHQYNAIKYGNDAETNVIYKDSSEIRGKIANFRQSIFADSLYYISQIDKFKSIINTVNPYFALKLYIYDSNLIIDTSTFNFDLYWINREKGVYDSKSIHFDSELNSFEMSDYLATCFPAFFTSKKISRVVKKVLKSDISFLLYCEDILDGLIYVKNDKIYICCYIDSCDYELDYYMKNKFKR